jgi:hypothetical protein
MESGNTSGIIRGIENIKNLMIRYIQSLPASSAMNSQTVCSMNIKNKITNTVVNVIRNVLISICQEFSPKN